MWAESCFGQKENDIAGSKLYILSEHQQALPGDTGVAAGQNIN